LPLAAASGSKTARSSCTPASKPRFKPARKAHPALIVEDLTGLFARLEAASVKLTRDEPLAGYDRVFAEDPFGNRIELLEPIA
jgi:catechol 2,3-dioxygenase-like lactoylglutathione lyase family enzyme